MRSRLMLPTPRHDFGIFGNLSYRKRSKSCQQIPCNAILNILAMAVHKTDYFIFIFFLLAEENFLILRLVPHGIAKAIFCTFGVAVLYNYSATAAFLRPKIWSLYVHNTTPRKFYSRKFRRSNFPNCAEVIMQRIAIPPVADQQLKCATS